MKLRNTSPFRPRWVGPSKISLISTILSWTMLAFLLLLVSFSIAAIAISLPCLISLANNI